MTIDWVIPGNEQAAGARFGSNIPEDTAPILGAGTQFSQTTFNKGGNCTFNPFNHSITVGGVTHPAGGGTAGVLPNPTEWNAIYNGTYGPYNGHAVADILNPLGVRFTDPTADDPTSVGARNGTLYNIAYNWTVNDGSYEDLCIQGHRDAFLQVNQRMLARLWHEPGTSSWFSYAPDYIIAWRKIYNFFNGSAGHNPLAPNQIPLFVWCPNGDLASGGNAETKYDPGHAYVDWYSIDAYVHIKNGMPSYSNLQKWYDAYNPTNGTRNGALLGGNGVPLMLSEWGIDNISTTHPSRLDVFNEFVGRKSGGVWVDGLLQTNFKDIKALTYWKTKPASNVCDTGGNGDIGFSDCGPGFLQAVRDWLATPYMNPVTSAPGTLVPSGSLGRATTNRITLNTAGQLIPSASGGIGTPTAKLVMTTAGVAASLVPSPSRGKAVVSSITLIASGASFLTPSPASGTGGASTSALASALLLAPTSVVGKSTINQLALASGPGLLVPSASGGHGVAGSISPKVVSPPASTITYRLVLANLGTSGLGTPIVSGGHTLDDVMTLIGIAPGVADPVRWTKNINAPGAIEFSLPADDALVTMANFAEGKREVHLYRNDGSGEVLWAAGRLWTSDMQDWGVRFAAEGFYSTLRRREFTDDEQWIDVEQHDIAWNAIAYTQAKANGNLGITRHDSVPTGFPRTLLVCAEERRSPADIIEEMAAFDDGFDFDVGPDKVFRIWSPRRGGVSAAVFRTTEVETLTFQRDALSVSSSVSGLGKVEQCEPVFQDVVSDATALSGFGLLQSTVSRPDFNEENDHGLDMLQSLMREELRTHKTPRFQVTVTYYPEVAGPQVDDYEVGDTARFISSRGFATFDQYFRIVSIECSVGVMNREHVTVTADSVIS